MFKESKKARLREKVKKSSDPNAILWVLDQRTAHALFKHSLNARTAYKLSDEELSKLKGVGPKAVKSVRNAVDIARSNR